MADRNNGSTTVDRDRSGRFAKGNPGRKFGSRHKTTTAVEALLDGEAEGLTRKAIELALDGDSTALRLCLERIAPARKDRPVVVDLPEMKSAEDATRAMGAVLDAVASGEVTPEEARSLSALVESFRRVLETEDLERRVQALEERK